MKSRGPGAALLVALACLTGTSSASAAEEMIVTAQRREEKLQDVPLAVTALGAGDVDRLQINVVQHIGQNVPNLQTYPITAGAEAIQVHSRGASVQNPGFNASESPVGFYEDDVYRGRMASINLNLADVERLEVLRGPQATLYGRNTIAGAVKIITRTPGDDAWIDGSLGYGNYNTLTMSGSVGGPIDKGTLAGSMAFVYDRRGDGWQYDPVTGDHPGAYENRALRGKLHWYGSPAFDATLSVWGVKATNDGYNGVPYTPFVNPNDPTDARSPVPSAPIGGFYDNFSAAGVNFGDTSQYGATLNWAWKLGDGLKLRSITAFGDFKDRFGFDLAGGGFLGFPGVGGLLINSRSGLTQWSQELQLLGNAFSDRLEWIGGLYYLNESGTQDFGGVVPGFVDFVEHSKTNTNSYAAFAEGTWHFTDRLSATAGVRWTNDNKKYQNACTGADPTTAGTCVGGPVDLGRSFDQVTPKVALDYRFTDAVLGYVQYGRGFQAGGFQTLCFGNLGSGPDGCAGNTYDPETVDSIELGMKSDWFDRTLRLNIAVFDAMYHKLQESVVGTAGNFPLANVGNVDVYGVEAEVSWRPVDTLHVFVTLGAMTDNIRERIGNAGCQVFDTVDPTKCVQFNEHLESLPAVSGKVGFDYTIPMSDRVAFFYGLDLFYTDSYYSEYRNLVKIPDYVRLNGFVGLGQPGGRWQATLTAKNITSRQDLVSGLYAGGFTNVRTPLPPPEYMMTVKVRF